MQSCRWSRGTEHEGRRRTVTVTASTNMLGLVCPQASGLKVSLTVYPLELSPHPRLEDSPMGSFIWNSSVQNSNQGCSGEIVGTLLWPPGLPSRSSQDQEWSMKGPRTAWGPRGMLVTLTEVWSPLALSCKRAHSWPVWAALRQAAQSRELEDRNSA